MLEFGASVLGGEPPVYDCGSLVAFMLKRRYFCLQYHFVADPAVEALSTEDAQFNLSHVEPTAMFGSVVKLQAFGYTTRFGWFKCFVQRTQLVSIEVVQHQTDHIGMRIGLVEVPSKGV